jgi:hypothetical protein
MMVGANIQVLYNNASAIESGGLDTAGGLCISCVKC